METYVSVVSWCGDPQPDSGDIRAAIRRQNTYLRRRGLYSVAFFNEAEACSAVMVSTVHRESELEPLAAAILPGVSVRIESMRFDGDSQTSAWSGATAKPRQGRREYLDAVLQAVEMG